ncbi:hypothetical protein EV385_4809 [Krasilnikovia cinnamomea]|uniref:DUF1152 domain-containing protein n=1 Tax=Krasilnikovia cinnamomea TaxID=349313 RepID=A0A4Q7ZR37_9ACTN|nr:DUF1152 domain-containing protein [Krasilnikovia cinnamomea]RZU52925.1 hypothetical protein EV385_4809 [Krasilnikovia cinnamomea]
MSNDLYVAAGGGGDALAALMLCRALGGSNSAPTVASYSWDRYLIDPAPGPRQVQDFVGLRQLTEHAWEVTADSNLAAGGVSGLTVLARHTPARFMVMDPARGAAGLRQQLREVIDHLSVDRVTLVDVGGDVAAHGSEASLLSPLGDALALAATAELPVPTDVAVIGPGLDGELPDDELRNALVAMGADVRKLRIAHVRPFLPALEHHPSEATMLVAAAAMGASGRAEIRDKGALVSLTDHSTDAFLTSSDSVLERNAIAQKLIATESFDQAEAITREICGRTELDHERRKSEMLAHRRTGDPSAEELRSRLREYREAAAARGADFVSFRRLTEVLGLHRYDPTRMRALVGDLAFHELPLCRISLR